MTKVSYVDLMSRELGHHYIRAWREYRDLSLRALANRIEVEPGVPLMSHANIGRIETGEQPYTQEFLEAASVALRCSVSDLLSVDPRINDAVSELNQLLRAASKDDQQKALDVVRALLKTGTEG